MAYHGEDLDLRTPQTWAAVPADVIPPGEFGLTNGKRGSILAGPVLVDDTVLTSFNQAYDIASAHRAAEVRVEHLLNAMTRLDAAAHALEAHSIRVVALKRETATIIAGEIPAVSGSGAVSPRRSDDLAEVLRLAAVSAARRNSAVTVDDLLQVLFDHRSEFGASELLLRFASRVAEPLPPLTRAEPRYAATSTRYAVDYPRPAAYRSDYLGTATDASQNLRIEALEQAVRALGQDLANERHTISGIVRDLARDTVAHQDSQGRTHAILLDRIGSLETAFRDGGAPASGEPSALVSKLEDIETALELRLQEMSQSWAVLSTRLQELEASVRDRPVSADGGVGFDIKPVTDRLDIIEEALLGHRGFSEVGDRLSRLEDGVGQILAMPSGDGSAAGFVGGFDKIEGLSGKLDNHYGSLRDEVVNLTDRVGGTERAVTAEIETAAAKHEAYTRDLTEVHDALLKVNQNQHTLAGSMDQWRTESASDVAAIMNRLAAIDRDTGIPAETLTALNAHMDAMNKFIIERYHRRHRFLYWLFGTDDWIGASWPSTRASVENDQHRLKVVGETNT